MSDQERIASEYFQRLNLTELKLQAQRWANQYPSVPIERIELYRYSSKFKKYFKGKPTIKYAIIFFVSSVETVFESAIDHYNLTLDDLSFCEISKIWDEDAFKELVSDTEYYQTGPELVPFRAFMDADFEFVYTKQLRNTDLIKEWIFIPLVSDEKLPMGVISKPHIVLHPDKVDIKEKIPRKKSIDKAKPIPQAANVDDFIRKLKIYFENDSEIKIQEPGKEAKIYNVHVLGFRNNRTKSWIAFIELLENQSHIYNIGPSYVKDYDIKRKCLSQINKKLIDFFTKHYKIKFPQKYKLYEKAKSEGKGAYKFKFKVGVIDNAKASQSKYERYPKDKLLKKIYELSKKDKNSEEFLIAISIAAKKEWITKDKVREMIPETYKKNTVYDEY
jgi:hypothetical protein